MKLCHIFVITNVCRYFLLISDPTFGRIFDGQEICNGHTFEHINDYDIKLETTKIKHAFDKVWYRKLG